MADSILKLLGLHAQTCSARSRFYGVYPALVTAIAHDQPRAVIEEERGYRVKLKFPWLDAQGESYWARQTTFMAGPDRGAFFMPEVEDEVLVAFEHGDIRFPVVIGQLWNGQDCYPSRLTVTPRDEVLPVSVKDQQGKNDLRFLQSREGHLLLFCDQAGRLKICLRSSKGHEIDLDDQEGAEQIRIYNRTRENLIEIDTRQQTIRWESKTGELTLRAAATITLECRDLVTRSSQSTLLQARTSYAQQAGGSMLIHSGSQLDLKAGGVMTLKAPLIRFTRDQGPGPSRGGAERAAPPAAASGGGAGGAAAGGGGGAGDAAAGQGGDGGAAVGSGGTTTGGHGDGSAGGGRGPAGAGGRPEGTPPPRQPPLTWVAICLVDDEDVPVPRERYQLTLPDGTIRTGELDEEGSAREEGVPAGTCQVAFPDLEDEEWERV